MTLYVRQKTSLHINPRGQMKRTIMGGQPLPEGALPQSEIDRLLKQGVLSDSPDAVFNPNEDLPMLPLDLAAGRVFSQVDREQTNNLRNAKAAVEAAQPELSDADMQSAYEGMDE